MNFVFTNWYLINRKLKQIHFIHSLESTVGENEEAISDAE